MEYMFMPLKRYADFSGRSRRMEYWMYTLFLILMWLAVFVLFTMIAGTAILSAANGSSSGIMAAGGSIVVIAGIAMVIWLALLIPTIAVGVRRLHDTDRSGWWLGGYLLLAFGGGFIRGATGIGALSMIISLATLAYAIAILVFMCLEGTKGPNKYGPDPKGQVDAQVFA